MKFKTSTYLLLTMSILFLVGCGSSNEDQKAEESLEETKVSFKVLNNTIDLLNAQAIWQSANAQLISSLAQYEVLQTTWLKVTGNLNPTE